MRLHFTSKRSCFSPATTPRRKQLKQCPTITVTHSKVKGFDIAQIGYDLAHVVMN